MALIPRGVAALFRPSMFAASASTSAPPAGWPGGTSGKSHLSAGLNARPTSDTSPAASATRIMPSQSVMMPTRPIAICTAPAADSTAPFVTSAGVPLMAATTMATAIRPNQM